jgi:hypothetical protein
MGKVNCKVVKFSGPSRSRQKIIAGEGTELSGQSSQNKANNYSMFDNEQSHYVDLTHVN